MFGLTSKQRTALYLIGNGCLLVLVAMLGAHANAPTGQVIYLFLMLAVCTAPLILLENLNGPYVLLGIFMAVYFVFFAAFELLTLLGGESASLDGGFMSATESGLVLGALCAFLGYLIGTKFGNTRDSAAIPKDWARSTILIVGLALWLAGAAAIVYYQVYVVPVKSNAATQRGLANLGAVLTFVVMLGQLAEPLGILILAYAYARFRTLPWLLLILVVVLSQVGVGFVCDIKSLGMIGGILVILAKVLVDNKLPKAWLAGAVVFIVVIFPMFQAYRAEVAGERGLTRTQALEDIGHVLEIVLSTREQENEGHVKQHTASFLERASLKGNVELAVERTGVDTPFQEGRTMVALLTAFIPRLIWPDKPDVAVGQEFNHVFIHGENDTYISPSHFGELYWNYGWPGITFGMWLIGALLGFVGAKCNMAKGQSVTRLLVLLATAKGLCLGFEGSIAIAYVVWLRSLAAIWILHLMFARRVYAMAIDEARSPAAVGPSPDAAPGTAGADGRAVTATASATVTANTASALVGANVRSAGAEGTAAGGVATLGHALGLPALIARTPRFRNLMH